jgi:hypothetical protein
LCSRRPLGLREEKNATAFSDSTLPKLIRQAMKADTDAVLIAFGKNEHTKKVFWALFAATAGLVLAQVVDPAAAQEIVGILAGIIPGV